MTRQEALDNIAIAVEKFVGRTPECMGMVQAFELIKKELEDYDNVVAAKAIETFKLETDERTTT